MGCREDRIVGVSDVFQAHPLQLPWIIVGLVAVVDSQVDGI